jgi:DNA-binding transcriptional ArsR family regulator
MRSVGVVTERRAGRERYYRLERDRLGEVENWLMRIDRFWERGLRRLGEHLDSHP